MGKNIVNKYPKGILQLVGQKLKDDILGKVLAETDHLRSYLYKITLENVGHIKGGIEKIQKNVRAETKTLEQFVKFVGAVQTAQDDRV